MEKLVSFNSNYRLYVVKATGISIYRSSKNPKCLDKTKLYSMGNPIGMRYNAICPQTINPLLPA